MPMPRLSGDHLADDEDTHLLLHAKALLTILGGTYDARRSLPAVAGDLVTLEQRSWESNPIQGYDSDVLAEVITVLSVYPAETLAQAADLLQRVPQFAHDSAHNTRRVLAQWACRRYPPGPDHRLNLRPHLVAERLILDTLARTPELLVDDDTALPVLTRMCTSFPHAVDLLVAMVTRQPGRLAGRLRAILATAVPCHRLDRALAAVVRNAPADAHEELARLTIPGPFSHLRCAIDELEVRHCRDLVEKQPGRHEHALADALVSSAITLGWVGRHSEALAAHEQAVAICRTLAEKAPEQAKLAKFLRDLGASLALVGKLRDALVVRQEALAICLELVETQSDLYRTDLARSLESYGSSLRKIGRRRAALASHQQATEIFRELAEAAPGEYRPALAASLQQLAASLGAVGRHREALTTYEEALDICQRVVTGAPEQDGADLAEALLVSATGCQRLNAITRHSPSDSKRW
jgi:tetratricopeptide (TPR) repeat protein